MAGVMMEKGGEGTEVASGDDAAMRDENAETVEDARVLSRRR